MTLVVPVLLGLGAGFLAGEWWALAGAALVGAATWLADGPGTGLAYALAAAAGIGIGVALRRRGPRRVPPPG